MGRRKALIIGIDKYSKKCRGIKTLKGCVNDADAMAELLAKNDDRSKNFDVKILKDKNATYDNVLNSIIGLFSDDEIEVKLLYFAGHGYDNKADGAIVTSDGNVLPFKAIMDEVNKNKNATKVVIMDCCFSGRIGNGVIGDEVKLVKNTTIITSCSPYEKSKEKNKQGVFTSLLIDGLKGGAANVLGEVTASALYAYIDKSLMSWEQRPFFKAHVSYFTSLRSCKKRLTEEEMEKCMSLFDNPNSIYRLNPSYEFTNDPNYEIKLIKPYANENNVNTFKLLQKMYRNGIVEPFDEEHMYFAAINSKGCKLTPVGQHYWDIMKKDCSH